MALTIYIALFGWPLVSLTFFLCMRPAQAVLAGVFAGWLLLPQSAVDLPGLPDYTRFTGSVIGAVAGALIFDAGSFARLRIGWIDVPIVIWCVCPALSSLSNGLGIYDGLSAGLTATVNYGLPYLLGRAYYSTGEGIRTLAIGLVIAVLCYSILILYELKQSPHLHRSLYGFLQIKYHMIWRLGWYRPLVFLKHGLELGILLASASTVAVWLWVTQAEPRIGRFSARFTAYYLVILTIGCRALNGYGAMLLGIGLLYGTKVLRTPLLILGATLMPATYVAARVVSNWDAQILVDVAAEISEDRAASLQSRISHEVTLIDKARQRIWFGWGGWGRNRADNLAEGAMGKRSITDSWWIIVLGQNGLTGLVSLGLVLLMPAGRLAIRLTTEQWSAPEYAPACALATVLLGFTVDCLVNAMVSPIYFIIAGALLGFQPHLQTDDDLELLWIDSETPHAAVHYHP